MVLLAPKILIRNPSPPFNFKFKPWPAGGGKGWADEGFLFKFFYFFFPNCVIKINTGGLKSCNFFGASQPFMWIRCFLSFLISMVREWAREAVSFAWLVKRYNNWAFGKKSDLTPLYYFPDSFHQIVLTIFARLPSGKCCLIPTYNFNMWCIKTRVHRAEHIRYSQCGYAPVCKVGVAYYLNHSEFN